MRPSRSAHLRLLGARERLPTSSCIERTGRSPFLVRTQIAPAGEKTPRNIKSFAPLLDHFGSDVRLIHLVRDGRDATTSRHLRRPSEYYYSPETWAEIVADGLRFTDHPQVVLVRYEDLV